MLEHPFLISTYNTVFENHRKSLIQHCERSELHLLGVARLTEKPKNRTEISKTEPNRNRNLEIFQKPNRTETEVINRG